MVKRKTRRGWIKIHIAFDVIRRRIIEVKVTDEKTSDSQKAQEIVEPTLQKGKGKKISKVIADAGYDNLSFFHFYIQRVYRQQYL